MEDNFWYDLEDRFWGAVCIVLIVVIILVLGLAYLEQCSM